MRLTLTTLFVGLVILGLIFEMLRRRKLREKYAALWLITAVIVAVLAAFPSLFDGVAGLFGIRSGVSLVLFLGLVFLLALSMHLSWEVSQLEEETRTLAEEIALLRLEIGAAPPPGATRPGTTDPDPLTGPAARPGPDAPEARP